MLKKDLKEAGIWFHNLKNPLERKTPSVHSIWRILISFLRRPSSIRMNIFGTNKTFIHVLRNSKASNIDHTSVVPNNLSVPMSLGEVLVSKNKGITLCIAFNLVERLFLGLHSVE